MEPFSAEAREQVQALAFLMPQEQEWTGRVFSSAALLQLHWRAGLAPQEQRASEAQTQVEEFPLQQVIVNSFVCDKLSRMRWFVVG